MFNNAIMVAEKRGNGTNEVRFVRASASEMSDRTQLDFTSKMELHSSVATHIGYKPIRVE